MESQTFRHKIKHTAAPAIMLASFLTFINDNKIPLQNSHTLLTVSGGIDSVVMADLFYKAGFKASIAHCNFNLRGSESIEDEEFVSKLAIRYQFPFYVKQFYPKALSQEKGISTQMAARDLRYSWFEELRLASMADFIATAHHADDSFETVLLNLTRGTGLAGLRGIAVVNAHLVRPLLFATRDQIVAYALENKIAWREDRSNQSSDYKRNRIRHEVIPVLRRLNPALSETFSVSAQRINAAYNIQKHELEEWREKYVRTDEQGRTLIPFKALKKSSDSTYRLFSVLETFGFSYKTTLQVIASMDGIAGKTFSSSDYLLVKDREAFVLSAITPPSDPIHIPENDTVLNTEKHTISISTRPASEIPSRVTSSRFQAFFDTDQLDFPLHIRSWKNGDYFSPIGMHGKRKKISDLLIDQKVPLSQKKDIQLLCDANDRIRWVIGVRTDHFAQITDKTQYITTLEIKTIDRFTTNSE